MRPLENKPVVLVTGGAGYIGSSFVRAALSAGFSIRVLDSFDVEAAPDNDPVATLLRNPGVTVVRGSITELVAVDESLRGAEAVIHLAGISDGRAGKADPVLTRRVNSDSMESLLARSRAAGVKRFLFASTMGVYGNEYHEVLHEDLPLCPVDPYSESKAVGEEAVRAASDETFCATSLRIAMVYGLGVKVREDFLVNKMCVLAARTGMLTMVGGEQQRPQVHVEDLATLFLQLLSADAQRICGEVFNVVESNPSLDTIVAAIGEAKSGLHVERLPSRAGEDSFEMSGEKLRVALDYTPPTSLTAGIRNLVAHYQPTSTQHL